MRRIFFALSIAFLCAIFSYSFALKKGFVNPYSAVCDFVAKKIYLKDEDLKDWKKICHDRSRLVTPFSPKELIIQDLNHVFELLKVSHLEIYDPNTVQDIWQGESANTGIEGEFVESEFVIFKVHPKSAAEKVGLQRGDIVKSINQQQPSSWNASIESGIYEVVRGKKNLKVQILPEKFQRDDQMSVEFKGAKIAVVRVPSFRAEFFTDSLLEEIERKIAKSKMVILDLRGNRGGNFVAGLRFLSLFHCEPVEVGQLVKPRSSSQSTGTLPDELDDEKQLSVLQKFHKVSLRTFKRHSCYQGRVKVIIDGGSSSVTEMVTQALREFNKSPVLGARSQGQLLVGVWYSMNEVAPGVQISIPEAYFESHGGEHIEGQGVSVDRILFYKLQQMQSGIDSWVEESLAN